ncbi:hypothetical protein RFI_07178 [Reticulomyxa filosa]|uniref:Uncharacterized protein n=1 Tax=Reticulomyxa filosa TaxID=46433 RepID=X6NUG7_RETFI|nr:hypothetical protein RFI_07178 [Reticulomyxa filosa]|eukprot:ETO29940.1 hypothetical protein RFI_07178 [Reticulomyxa filosa]
MSTQAEEGPAKKPDNGPTGDAAKTTEQSEEDAVAKKRRRQAQARQKRLEAGGKNRLDFINNRISKVKLDEITKENMNKSPEELAQLYPDQPNDDAIFSSESQPSMDRFLIGNDITMNNDIFNIPTTIPSFQSPLIDPGQIMTDILAQACKNEGSNEAENNTIESEIEKENNKKMQEWKQKEEQLNRFDEWLHIAFIILFVFALFLFPNFTVFSYSLSSDTVSFFLAFECLLIGLISWYRGTLDSIKPKVLFFLFVDFLTEATLLFLFASINTIGSGSIGSIGYPYTTMGYGYKANASNVRSLQ